MSEDGRIVKHVIIENLEPCLSPWLLSEYRYVAKLYPKNLVFTNVTNKTLLKELSKLGKALTQSFTELISNSGIDSKEVIVLDPSAKEELRPEDLRSAKAVVIGGIMGETPMKGRTKKYITDRLPGSIPKNLGEGQLTIAGAAYVLKKIMGGVKLEEIELRNGLKVIKDLGSLELVIEIPYTFPYVRDEPVLPEDYVRVIAERTIYYESIQECSEEIKH